jgi:hypothetical protein
MITGIMIVPIIVIYIYLIKKGDEINNRKIDNVNISI